MNNQLERSLSFRDRSVVRSSSQSQLQPQFVSTKIPFRFFWFMGLICMLTLIMGAGILGNGNIMKLVCYSILSTGGLYALSMIGNYDLFFGNTNVFYVIGDTIPTKHKPYYKQSEMRKLMIQDGVLTVNMQTLEQKFNDIISSFSCQNLVN